jgi:hypothetical protein
MKVTFKNDKKFAPVTMSLTFETQNELDAFGCLVNASVIIDSIEVMGGSLPTYRQLEEVGANIGKTDTFLKALLNTQYIRNHVSIMTVNT